MSSSLNIRPVRLLDDDNTSTGRPWSLVAATRATAGRDAVGETTVWLELFLPVSCCDDDDDRDEVRLARIVFDRDRPWATADELEEGIGAAIGKESAGANAGGDVARWTGDGIDSGARDFGEEVRLDFRDKFGLGDRVSIPCSWGEDCVAGQGRAVGASGTVEDDDRA